MKVTAISDLHGNLIDIEPCDLLLICGDISPLEIQRDYIQMTKWIFNEFQEWIMKIDCPTIILTPGNHDFWFEKMITQSNTYLFNKLTILMEKRKYIIVLTINGIKSMEHLGVNNVDHGHLWLITLN